MIKSRDIAEGGQNKKSSGTEKQNMRTGKLKREQRR